MDYETSVEIAAPADVAWPILADVERWPEWTDSVRAVRFTSTPPLAVGSTVRVKQPGFPPVVWEVTELEPGRSFVWVNRSPGLTSTGSHVIEPRPDGCAVTLRISQVGAFAGLLALLSASRTRRYVDMEAAGLKRRAEEGPQAGR